MMFSYDTIREMNETELGIYKYITANSDKIPFMTIRELSDAVQVSTSTVLRFCNTAGFEKYAEFKEAVQSEKEELINTPPQEDLKEILQYMTGTNTSAFYSVGNNFPHGGALVVLSESGETTEVNNFVLQFRKMETLARRIDPCGGFVDKKNTL